ncbi:uncharacterized protein LOC135207401 [Macrobrachium nipponense]|uniref:uncharacterized protein LOC135207401 n=1 Tax=Macrobrachium nipponense TaxID=159736 RepID=UPI0030C828A7
MAPLDQIVVVQKPTTTDVEADFPSVVRYGCYGSIYCCHTNPTMSKSHSLLLYYSPALGPASVGGDAIIADWSERPVCLSTIQDALQECSVKEWISLLGTLSSREQFVSLGRLHMMNLQFLLKINRNKKKFPDSFVFQATSEIKEDLSWWRSEDRLLEGMSLLPLIPDLLFYSDMSSRSWGALLGRQESLGDMECLTERLAHQFERIDYYPLRAVGILVTVHSDNTTALLHQEVGRNTLSLCEVARALLLWADRSYTRILTRFIQGKVDILAKELSHKEEVLLTEWVFNPLVCLDLWRLWGRPILDLFATSKNQCPALLLPSPWTSKHGRQSDNRRLVRQRPVCLPPFKKVREVINKFRSHQNISMTLIAPFWAVQECFPDPLELLVDFPSLLPEKTSLLKTAPFQAVPIRSVHSGPDRLSDDLRVKGLLSKAARAVAQSRRKSSSEVYQAKWAILRSWCKEYNISSSKTSVAEIADFLLY